jgi:hypothetical protein
MSLNTENYPKAELAISYRKEIYNAVDELSQYHEEYGSLILSVLEENPQIKPNELKEIVFEKFERDYKPYKDQRLNDALVEVSILGLDAVEELKSIIDVLGSTIDLDSAKERLAKKYGKNLSEPDRSKQNDRHKNQETAEFDEAKNDKNSLINAGQSALQGIRPKEDLDVDVDVTFADEIKSDLKPKLSEEISKVSIGDERYEYNYDGKNYYSYEAANRAKESGSYNTPDSSDFVEKRSESRKKESSISSAVSYIRLAGWFGIISLAISFYMFFFEGRMYRGMDQGLVLLELVISCFLVWGVFAKSRVAATLLLILFVGSKIVMISLEPRAALGNPLVLIGFFAAYVAGVIGTFRYHKLKSMDFKKDIIDAAGKEIHRQMLEASKLNDSIKTIENFVFINTYIRTFLFNVAYSRDLHGDWCFENKYIKQMCENIYPTQLWKIYKKAESLKEDAKKFDVSLQKIEKLGETAANHDVWGSISDSTNLKNYLTGKPLRLQDEIK